MVLVPTQRLQAMTKNIQLENLALKLVGPETSRLLATGFPEARKRYKGLQASTVVQTAFQVSKT